MYTMTCKKDSLLILSNAYLLSIAKFLKFLDVWSMLINKTLYDACDVKPGSVEKRQSII